MEFKTNKSENNAANYCFYFTSYFIEKHFTNLIRTPPSFYSFINDKENYETKKFMYFDKDFYNALDILKLDIESFKEKLFQYVFIDLPKKIGYGNIKESSELYFRENFTKHSTKRHELYEFADHIDLEPLRMDILNKTNEIIGDSVF